MRTLQRRTGVLIIAAMVAAVLLLSVPGQQMWRKVLQDAGHGPVFAVIAIVLALMRAPDAASRARSGRVLWQSLAIAAGIGAATELVQFLQPGRSVSLLDVLHDTAGAALGLAALSLVERRAAAAGGAGWGDWAWPAGLAALVVLAWPPLECAHAYARRASAFPVLLSGETRADLYFLRAREAVIERASLPDAYRKAGDLPAVHVVHLPGARPGIELFEPAPDWRGHAILSVDLTNPGRQPLVLVLRIFDARHDWEDRDRLNLPLVIPPETRTTARISIASIDSAPAGRAMDLASVANVMLFSPQAVDGSGFYVSSLRLE